MIDQVLAELRHLYLDTLDPSRSVKLPSERDLAERFQVSRETVRGALQVLEDEGRITRRGTAGTFTVPQQPADDSGRVSQGDAKRAFLVFPHRFTVDQAHSKGSYLAQVVAGSEWDEDHEDDPRITPVVVSEYEPAALLQAPPDVASAMDLPAGALVLRRRLLLSESEDAGPQAEPTRRPLSVMECFYPGTLFRALVEETVTGERLRDVFYRALVGGHQSRALEVYEVLTIRLASALEREHLLLPGGSPVADLVVTVVTRTELNASAGAAAREAQTARGRLVVEWIRASAVASRLRLRSNYHLDAPSGQEYT